MASASIVLIRGDLVDNSLQVTDLWPNTPQKSAIYEPGLGQTGYLSFIAQNDAVAVTGAGPILTNADYLGLQAYLLDNVENVGGGQIPLTPAECVTIAAAILTRVAGGLTLTLANVNTAINSPAGVSASDLNGVVANSDSTGTLAALFMVLQGRAYLLPAGSTIDDGAGSFTSPHTPAGAWVASTATGFRGVREFELTGALRLSRNQGVLAQLAAATYVFVDPLLVYGAGGDALFVDGTVIPVGGAGAAVVVYDVDGNVLI